jgi:hypothetical protein
MTGYPFAVFNDRFVAVTDSETDIQAGVCALAVPAFSGKNAMLNTGESRNAAKFEYRQPLFFHLQ